MSDVVTIVSLGPGDPELITLKGLNALKDADFIFCPYTITSGDKKISRANDILIALNIECKKILPFDLSMSKNRMDAIKNYYDTAIQIENKYKAGYNTVLVAEGDAGFYSSSHYINEILIKKNIPVQRIAGIPAFIACAAFNNIPVSRQKDNIEIITNLSSAKELIDKKKKDSTLVIMKTSQCESMIKDALKMMPDTKAYYYENTGIPEKEFYTDNKEEILSKEFPYFSLIIIQ